jgi:hypothetical protein
VKRLLAWRILSFVFLLLSFVVMAQLMRFDIGDRQINGDDYFAVIEPVFWSVSIYDGFERYERTWRNSPRSNGLFLRVIGT